MANLVKAMGNLQKAFEKAGSLEAQIRTAVEALAKEDEDHPLTIENTMIDPTNGLVIVFFNEDQVPLWKILRIAATLGLDVRKMEVGLSTDEETYSEDLCLMIDLNPDPPEEGP